MGGGETPISNSPSPPPSATVMSDTRVTPVIVVSKPNGHSEQPDGSPAKPVDSPDKTVEDGGKAYETASKPSELEKKSAPSEDKPAGTKTSLTAPDGNLAWEAEETGATEPRARARQATREAIEWSHSRPTTFASPR